MPHLLHDIVFIAAVAAGFIALLRAADALLRRHDAGKAVAVRDTHGP